MPFLGKFPTQIVDPEVDIDGGAIDGVTIGATTASAATVTTLTSGNITTTGYIAGPSTFTIDPAAVGDNTGTLVVAGNLQVDGTTTTINSTTMTVDDLNITLASGAANAAAANGAGITVDGASATLTYNSTPDAWSFNKNVGIGTASPIYALHTVGSSDGTIAAFGNGQDNANILLQAAANYGSDNSVDSKWSIRWRGRPNAGGHSLAIYDEENSAERMRIDSSGNVGIGTASPATPLHIKGTTAAQIRSEATTGFAGIHNTNSSGNFYHMIDNSTGAGFSSGAYARVMYSDGAYPMAFYTNANERMRIDSSGNVGIGTSTPDVKLHIQGSNGAVNPSAYSVIDLAIEDNAEAALGIIGNNYSSIYFGDATNVIQAGIVYNHSTDELELRGSGNTTDLTIESSGTVSMGSLRVENGSGGGSLQIGDNTGANQYQYINFGGNTSGDVAWQIGKKNNTADSVGPSYGFYIYDVDNSVNRFSIDSSGNVGIGNSDPNLPLTVTSNSGANAIALRARTNDDYSFVQFYNNAGTTLRGQIANHNGDLNFYTGSSGTIRAKIDSSARVFIGKTSDNDNTAGHTLHSSGLVVHTRDSSFAAIFNRTTNDGDIAQFKKDGALVGKIASGASGTRLKIYSQNVAGYLGIGSTDYFAWNTTDFRPQLTDSYDLGASGARFKDLYLSGGAYLGGTAAANKLDDYEEGTYTPSYTGSSSSGSTTYSHRQGVYTKIGRTVTVWIDMTITAMSGASGVPYISLPFTSGTAYGTDSQGQTIYDMGAFISWQTSDNFVVTSRPTGWITNNSGVMQMYRYTTAGTGSIAQWALNTTGRISGKIIYTAAF